MSMSNKRRTLEDDEKYDIPTNAFSADNEAPKIYSRSDEEFAAELAGGSASRYQDQPANQTSSSTKQADKGRAWGITALVLSIAAWFSWPFLLAPAAVITGIIAFMQGRRGLGSVAIVVGLIALVSSIAIAIL
jgi:hypothetical protein